MGRGDPLDEFGTLKSDRIKDRIDGLFIALNNDPTATGHIINYGSAKEKALRIRIINQTIVFRKFAKDRLVYVDGSGSPIKTDLRITPQGAKPPDAGA